MSRFKGAGVKESRADQQQDTIVRQKRALMGTRYQATDISGAVTGGERGKSPLNDAGERQEKTVAEYHSELAMQAARRMRRTRQKQKTGQEVCHHLRMMLASEPAPTHRSQRYGETAPESGAASVRDEQQISLGI